MSFEIFASGPLNPADRRRLLPLIETAVDNFTSGDWLALGTHTGCGDIIDNHGRLLRALSFGDDDYSGAAHQVMLQIAERDHANIEVMEEFIFPRFGGPGENISTAHSRSKPIVFAPNVFDIPASGVEQDLVAVMMPFAPQFEAVFEAIKDAAGHTSMRCLRAKDIWQHSVVIQDVFSLIYRSHIVVCDFTGKNANVFYEAGIAHTLGKHVVPITQSPSDIPFDVQHHRYLTYLDNEQGHQKLKSELRERLWSLR